jgi:hypothetical protein
MAISILAKTIAGAALATAIGLVAAVPAYAVTEIPIAGTGYAAFASGVPGVGDTGVDAFGNAWTWSKTIGSGPSPGAGLSVWGTPGLGLGEVPYGSSTPATDFEISFLTAVGGADILQTASPGPSGYNEYTRFSACPSTGCIAWTPVYTDGTQVVFSAPAGTSLVDGEDFFVNITFTKGTLSGTNAGFSAVYTKTVPETSTWVMLLLGFAALGYGAVRKGRAQLGQRLA